MTATQYIIIFVVLLNLALHIVRMAIAADLREDSLGDTGVTGFRLSNPAVYLLVESVFISSLLGIGSCWMALGHVIRWRRSSQDSTHALDIIAFIFSMLSLGYAAKSFRLDHDLGSEQNALAVLSIIQPLLQLIQLACVVAFDDGFVTPVPPTTIQSQPVVVQGHPKV